MKLESTIRDHAGLLYTAPLLDVVLLLLVFFLLGSNLVLKSGIPVTVPTSSASLPPIESSHIITVLPGAPAQVYFNQYKVTLNTLPDYLNDRSSNIRHVIIRGDRFAPFGLVVDISNLVKEYGYELAYATTNER